MKRIVFNRKISIKGLEGVVVKSGHLVDSDQKMIFVYSDYNPLFVKEARKLNGKFRSDKAWMFDARDKERVLEMLRDVYGDDGSGAKQNLVTVTVSLDKVAEKSGYQSWQHHISDSLFMFGRQILKTWGRDSRVIIGDGVIVETGSVYSTGSKKYPQLGFEQGTMLIIRDVPEILLKKEDHELFIVQGSNNTDEFKKEFDFDSIPDNNNQKQNDDTDLLALEFEALELELKLLDMTNLGLAEIADFDKWFSGSKIVDEKGRPLKVYHATNNFFTEFLPERQGSNTEAENTHFGFFFLEYTNLVQDFIDKSGNGKNTYILEAYLNIKNPIDIRIRSLFNNEEQASLLVKLLFGKKMSGKKALQFLDEEIGLGEIYEVMEELQSARAKEMYVNAGYDGMISDYGDNVPEYIAFYPSQIRVVKITQTKPNNKLLYVNDYQN